jgi:hypothetical protein
MTEPILDLVQKLSDAKAAQAAANARRIEAEKALIVATGFDMTEGSETYNPVDDRGSAKFILTQPINATIDQEAWRKARRSFPAQHPAKKVMKEKFSLDLQAARALQKEDHESWLIVADCVTRKPGKISVEIKSIVLGPLE